jgi:sugar phosphate isomerase/epimerase
MDSNDRPDTPALAKGLGLNRRQFLAATTGMAAAATLAGPLAGRAAAAPAAGPAAASTAANGVVVPPGKRGIILYTVRDAISRDPATTPYASGFRAVFEELGRIGYKQVEFAGYRQHPNAPGGDTDTVAGAHLLRQWLDDNGLEAEGNHGSVPGDLSAGSLAAFDAACERANILGLGHIGTGGDPTGSAYQADWDAAAERWNVLGRRAAGHGLKLYTHNHDTAYNFLLDSGPLDAQGRPTRSSGIRRLEYFLTRTDPDYVFLEMDIYWAHVAQFRFRTYTAPDGSTVTSVFNPLGVVQRQPIRFPLFHAKDGDSRPDLPAGYEMVPFGTGDIDYRTFLSQTGARGYHNPMYEQDNAPGGAANPGQSLDFSRLSYQNMAALRA